MKFKVTMKDPDGVDESVKCEVRRFMEQMREVTEDVNLDADELDAMEQQHDEVVRDYIQRWFQYSEYLTVEIDTDRGTCTVVKP